MVSRASIQRFVVGRDVDATYLETVRDKLLFDRPPVRNRYDRFWVLLLLSTVIATGGVITNSTASVIGAMIVAPLMTPILATALSVATGDRRNIVRSLAIVVAGASAVIAFAVLLTWLVPGPVDTLNNPQITSRTTVGVIEFAVALASGAAGAFGVSREDVSDVLPGVAIAISLVPPLCVVGVCLASGSFGQAASALLLFVTNVLSILLAGSIVFGLAGFGLAAFADFDARARRNAAIAIGIATVALLVPLGATSVQLSQTAIAERDIRNVSPTWLQGTSYRLLDVTQTNGQLLVVIGGVGKPPTAAALQAQLVHSGARGIAFTVEVTPIESLGSAAAP